MSFRLVPTSVTLNDLERCNNPNLCVISPNSVAYWTDYVKVVGDTPILSAAKCRPKNQGFSDISITAILAGNHPSETNRKLIFLLLINSNLPNILHRFQVMVKF